MRIACLQFAPEVGDVQNNIRLANAILEQADPLSLDLLVLPELAFTGYKFNSLKHITPYLEDVANGATADWARTTAKKYDCFVVVGYAETVDLRNNWPTDPKYYNSAMMVNPAGETAVNYRKTHLYCLDETWALEGPDGFYDGSIPGLGDIAMGISMDLNPYKFKAPVSAWEFAYQVLHKDAKLVIISMAWMTCQSVHEFTADNKKPDLDKLAYWLSRLEPLIRSETEGEIIVVISSRCGIDDGIVYAGTSCVLGIQGGEVKSYGMLGRGDIELLIVDTTVTEKGKLVAVKNSDIAEDAFQSREARDCLETFARPGSSQVGGGSWDLYTDDTLTSAPTIETAPPTQLESENPDDGPDSAWSMMVNSSCDDDHPSVSRAEDLTTTTKSVGTHPEHGTPREASPTLPLFVYEPSKVDRSSKKLGTSIGSVASPFSEEPNPSSSTSVVLPLFPSSIPPTERPQSPKSRNTSRPRTAPREPALPRQDLIDQPEVMAAPVERIMAGSSIQPPFYDSIQADSEVSLAPHAERSTSPRPHSNVW